MTSVRFDIEPVRQRLLAACEGEPVRLDSDEIPTGCGVYLLRHVRSHPLYARFNMRPVYVGRATGLRQRIRTHRRTLEQVHDLDPDDFGVVCISTDSRAVSALYEELLHADLRPVWNQPPVAGFGNRDPGARRRQQRTSPFDRLHPGRHWVVGPVEPCSDLAAWVAAYD